MVACKGVSSRNLVGHSCSPYGFVKIASQLQQSPNFDAVDVGEVGEGLRAVIVVGAGW